MLWESGKVRIGEKITGWPELDKGRTYGFLIIFYEKDDDYIYSTRRGKFWIINDSKLNMKKILSNGIENSNLSPGEKSFIEGCGEALIGNYEKALPILKSVLKSDISPRTDVLIQIISIYKTIRRDLEGMEWYDEADKISIRLDYLLAYLKNITTK